MLLTAHSNTVFGRSADLVRSKCGHCSASQKQKAATIAAAGAEYIAQSKAVHEVRGHVVAK